MNPAAASAARQPGSFALLCASLQVMAAAPEYTERKKKPPGEIIRYSRDFLMKFVQVSGSTQHGGWVGPAGSTLSEA